jgi:hypothetical protein
MASENARANSQRAKRIRNTLSVQLRELQSLEAQIKKLDSNDLDERARAEHVAKAAAHVKAAAAALEPATKGPPSRGIFS